MASDRPAPSVGVPSVGVPSVGAPSVAASVLAALVRGARGVHWYLRELTGEADYDRHLERHRACGTPPLDRREFERRRWERRAATPGNRCC